MKRIDTLHDGREGRMSLARWARSVFDPNPATLISVFISVFVVYILCPVATSTDSRWTLYLAMSMIREHDADLDEYADLMEDRDYRVVYLNDHIYSYFPLGTPLAVVPYVWAVDRVYSLSRSTDFAEYLAGHFPNETTAKVEKIGASFIAALSVALMYLIVSRRLRRGPSLLLAFILAFSTGMLSTASRALWQHSLSVLCLTAVLWLILSERETRRWIFATGLLLGFSFVVRPTNSIAIALLSLYMLAGHRKHLVSFLSGVLIPLAVLVLGSWQTYGTILPAYYLPQRLGTNPQFIEALFGNLVSPNRGLFISSPVLLFSIVGMYLQIKRGHFSARDIEPYLLGILVLHWLVISSFGYWHGGWSLGPRFFTDVTPYLVYFLVPLFEDGSVRSSRPWKTAFALALLLSTLVHFRYAISDYPMLWNQKPVIIIDAPERVWDWSDLQVLRGFCEDKLEGAAPGCWLSLY